MVWLTDFIFLLENKTFVWRQEVIPMSFLTISHYKTACFGVQSLIIEL